MMRGGLLVTLLGLASAAAAAGAGATPSSSVVVPVPKPRDERIVSLGLAEVRELAGGTGLTVRPLTGAAAMAPARALTRGQTVSGEVQLQTAAVPPSRAELRFSDGTLLRLDGGTTITLLPAQRQVALQSGRLLVVADRMVGGITVLTRGRAFVPEGTTYLVDAGARQAGAMGAAGETEARVTVLEGAVCACMVTASAQKATIGQATARPNPGALRDQMILPGETWTARDPRGTQTALPAAIDLGGLLRNEPLLTAFSAPIPSLAKIAELTDQQRRKLLAGRNARLRREIFWKRQPRAPLRLPALLADPNSVTVTYE